MNESIKKIYQTLKTQNNKKAIITMLLLSLFVFLFCLDIVRTPYILNAKYNIEQSSITTHNYDVADNKFSQSASDPQILIPAQTEETINLISIQLTEGLKKNINCQIYYPDEYGNLSEKNSVFVSATKGSREISAVLPENHYEFLRIDIDGNFKLENISLLNATFICETQEINFKWGQFLIIFSIIVFATVIYIKRNSKSLSE